MLTARSLALAADGAFYLVRILGDESVFGPDARFLANSTRQGLVLIASRNGLTDTHELSLLLGLGQLVLPAIAWSVAVLLARTDSAAFAAVSMTAGLCAGATWLFSVGESVLAVPLTVLVAVLLWRPQSWRLGHAVLALGTAAVLVASYETAALTGALLAAWAGWRASVSESRVDRYGGAAVAVASLASVAVAIAGAQDPTQPPSGQSFLYYLVSFEPWPTYVALAAIWALVGGLHVRADRRRRALVAGGVVAVAMSAYAQDATSAAAYASRAGAVLASIITLLFLWWRWAIERRRHGEVRLETGSPRLATLPVVVVGVLLVPVLAASGSWARSLDAFRSEVARAQGVVVAEDVLPEDRRDVLFDWTSSSLSLLVRTRPTNGVLVDSRPSLVPFSPSEARAQIDDRFVWRDGEG
jgi:hypothetical protein